MIALLMHSFEPKPLSENQMAASKQRYLANCGEGMFDVSPQAADCPAFDALVLESWPCPGCEPYILTLHADGRARLDETPFADDSPLLQAHIGSAEFRRLANLVAALQFDRLGGYVEPPADAGNTVIRAGCDGQWSFAVNHGASEDDVAGVARCLHALKQRADWSQP